MSAKYNGFRGKYVILRYRGAFYKGYLRKTKDNFPDELTIGNKTINVDEIEGIRELKKWEF